MNSKQRLRARFLLILMAGGAGLLGSSLYWTQVIKGPTYAAKAEQQYVKPSANLFDRGTIFFQSKDGTKPAAAGLGSGYVVYITPTQLTDPTGAYDALSQYLKLDKADFLRRAAKPGDLYEEIARQVDATAARSIQTLSLRGVGAVPQTWRSYPAGSLAAHALGLVGENEKSSNLEGRYGLERSYEDILSRPGIAPSVNVFAQLFSGLRDSLIGANHDEGDIVTTIEPSAQAYLEKVLSDTAKVWHPDEIGGIVIDPSTGEIAAMASLPAFNPNDTSSVKNISVFSDPMVEHVYEMGSIMKPLTMAMALDTGAEKPGSTYDDVGCMTLNEKKICNYDGKARGVIPMQQILSQSLNVGAATIALKVGKQDFSKYFLNYGFAAPTGIDLPNETKGILKDFLRGSDIDIATASYGQGIAVSPVAMTRALSILGNGGYVVTPHVVKEIDYANGTAKEITPKKSGPVLKQQTLEEVTRMLVTVVDDKIAQAHPGIHFDHYSVAAKTGTAQIADHVHGGYYPDRYLHSFFGYFPAYQPKFLVFLYQIYPKGAQYASETLTDPFADIAKFLINYYNVPPDR